MFFSDIKNGVIRRSLMVVLTLCLPEEAQLGSQPKKISLYPTDAGHIYIHSWRHAHYIHTKVPTPGW